ncbi:MAG: helix-turn-helix domain-containing protein [Oscillospiraceae bacterium]|nr:helix-turn-helix domain-containing protein [Oscillospiraceae bacterium]
MVDANNNSFNNQNTYNKIKELSLGKKIKHLRIERKITQQELVGDFITRNMLSQIENDAATPSIKTLQYIADSLNVPLSFLMISGSDDEYSGNFDYDSPEAINAKSKKIFFEGDYEKYIAVIESNPQVAADYKDTAMLLGVAYLAMMVKSFSDGETDKCLEYYEKVRQRNFTGSDFVEKQIKSQADLYKILCQPIISNAADVAAVLSGSDSNVDTNEDYDFLKEIIDENGLCRYNMLSAYKSFKNGEFQKALDYLKEAEHIIEKSPQNSKHPYKEELYKLFESCCVKLEDYKNAHLYSSKLLDLYAETNKK